VPNDTAFAASDMLLRRLDAEVLVRTRQLLFAAVEEYEVMHDFEEAGRGAEF